MRRFRILQVMISVLGVLFAVGCAGSSSSTPAGTTMTTAQIKIGDSPADGIVAFELKVNSVVLHSSSGDITVLSTPTEIELMHNAGTFEPLSIVNIPAGTYTGATITVSNPEIEVINSSGQTVELTTTLASPTAQVSFSPPITIGSTPQVINFDFNVAASVAISGTNATVTPTFSATSSPVAASESSQTTDDGEVEATGSVTSVSGSSFTISVTQSSQNLTFATDSSTVFEEPLAGISSLTNGMIVEVEGVTQSDGSLLAKQVDSEVEQPEGLEIEGVVTSTTGSPVTQFVVVVQDDASSTSGGPIPGNSVTVNVDSSTTFSIPTDQADLSNLPFTPTFDATTLSVAQRVRVDTPTPGAASITASNVKLDDQAITGVVSNYSQNGSQATFTLTVASDSVFALLTGSTTLTVYQQPSTELNDLTSVSNGSTVRVRGLLFANGGFQLVAQEIGMP